MEQVGLTTDENDRKLNTDEISCEDVLKRKGTRETNTQPQIVDSWIWKNKWSIIVATVSLLFMLMVACGGMLISLMVGHDSVSKGYQGQGQQTTQQALSIEKLEKEILILSKDKESFRNQLVELRNQHQEDINRLEIHITESKNIVGLTYKTYTNEVSIEQLQTLNLQLSEKIQAFDVRLNQTQKQNVLLRATINRLKLEVRRNTYHIRGITATSKGHSLLKRHGFLVLITFLYIVSLLVCQMM